MAGCRDAAGGCRDAAAGQGILLCCGELFAHSKASLMDLLRELQLVLHHLHLRAASLWCFKPCGFCRQHQCFVLHFLNNILMVW